MSYEMSNQNAVIRYVNFLTRGTGNNYCHAELKFRYPVIKKADNNVCSVERFRIPLNAIPFNYQLVGAVILRPVGGGADIVKDLNITFSLGSFFDQLNSMEAGLIFILMDDGRVKIQYDLFDTYYIVLSQALADILNFPLIIGDINGGTLNNSFATGSAVVFDKIDQLEDVRLEIIGLPTSSEYLNSTIEGFVISDFLASASYTISKTGSNSTILTGSHSVSYAPRQDLILVPKQRRFINISGAQPIYNMSIKAFAIFRDGSKNEIQLPPRSVFSVKLAFYRKY
jgi:hypothetical protein